MKGDPTLTSSLASGRAVPIHYEQPGSPGSQMTYSTGPMYQYVKPPSGDPYWPGGSTPSPPILEYVSSYPGITAISVGDANMQLCSGGGYSVSASGSGPPSAWTTLPISGTDDFDSPVMPSEPKQCAHCGAPLMQLWKREGIAHYQCNSCGFFSKLNGMNRPPMRCPKPKQSVTPVNIVRIFITLKYIFNLC